MRLVDQNDLKRCIENWEQARLHYRDSIKETSETIHQELVYQAEMAFSRRDSVASNVTHQSNALYETNSTNHVSFNGEINASYRESITSSIAETQEN